MKSVFTDMTQAQPLSPVYHGYYQFSSWNLSYPLDEVPDSRAYRFGKVLCSVLSTISTDALVAHEIRERLVSHDADLKPILTEDGFFLKRIHEELQKSKNAIPTSLEDIRALSKSSILQEIQEHKMAIRNSPLAQYLDKFLIPRKEDFTAAENIFDDYANNDLAILSIIKNEAHPEWLTVISLESLLVGTLYQPLDCPNEKYNLADEWSVSEEVFHACCVYVLHHPDEYDDWRKHKLAYLRNKKYLMSFTDQELYTFPIFYIYDLINNGVILPIVFDIIGDNAIDSQVRYFVHDTMVSVCSDDLNNLRFLQKHADDYKYINGTALSFWPWYYPDIKEAFLAYYKDVIGSQVIQEKGVYSFIDSCLPFIVEQVLPEIENANQAVGLIILIQNARKFSPKWESTKFESFKTQMERILHLEVFHKSIQNVRGNNDATKMAARRLLEKYQVLKEYTNAPER